MFFYNLKRFVSYPGRRKKIVILTSVLVLFTLFSLLDMSLSSTVSALAETAVKSKSAEYINSGVEKIFSDVKFDDIYTVTRGNDGNITGIFLDSFTVNKLKSEITGAVIESVKQGNIVIDVPFGNAFDSLFFAGRGKKVRVKILSVGTVDSKLISKTEDSGVNQTHLSSYMSIKADITALVGGKSIEVSTQNEVLLCESVIVGKIPESFTNINVMDEETLRWLNSYK